MKDQRIHKALRQEAKEQIRSGRGGNQHFAATAVKNGSGDSSVVAVSRRWWI